MKKLTKMSLLSVLTALLLLGGAGAAQAAQITFAFTARINNPDVDGDGVPLTGLAKNSVVSGTLTFDSTTPDSNNAVSVGDYHFVLTGMSVTAGGSNHALASDPANIDSNRILIENNRVTVSGAITDRYQLKAGLSDGYTLQIDADDQLGTAFESDALPLTPPNIPSFVNNSFFYSQATQRSRGNITSLTFVSSDGPPQALAGPDVAALEGTSVTLDGTGSSDTNSPAHAIAYAWSQLSGPPVTLAGADTATPSFTAPLVPAAGASLVFQLTVSNDIGSSTDTVTVNVANVNNPPVANAGAEQSVGENSVVALNGAGSTDADGDTLTLQWSQVSGPTVTLNGADTVSPSFTAPDVTAAQSTLNLVFQLIVNDGMVSSGPSTVTIHVANVNDAPTANAGANQTVDELSIVTLDGSASSDPDNNPVTYQWTQIAGDVDVILLGADTATPGFVAPELALGGEPGSMTLTFELTVSDGYASSTSTVNVQVSNVNHAPIADAGSEQTVPEGTMVTLDGTGSADEDGDAITYSWSQIDGYVAVELSDVTSPNPTFTAPDVSFKGGSVTFRLTVSDAFGASSSDTVMMKISYVNNPPTITASGPQSADERSKVTLTADAADIDFSAISITWSQVSGPEVTKVNGGGGKGGTPLPGKGGSATSSITFGAPAVDRFEADVVFQAVADDGYGGTAKTLVTVHINNLNHAPVAQAPANLTTPEGSPVILVGQGSDPDKEENTLLSYSWAQTAGPVVELVPDGANVGFVAPMINSADPTASVTLTFTLTVTDPTGASSTDDVDVVVTNEEHAPVANAGGNVSANEAASVTLNGTGSTDPDGDELAYAWVQISGPAVVLNDANTAYPYFTTPFVNAAGATLKFQLTVSDGYETSTDVATVTVANINDPPTVNNASPSVAVLWPPNHSMISVSILGVIDPNNNATVRITCVTQDEPTNGLGDGDTAIDAVINANGTVLLRAERAGNGNGRVYHIHFTASDFEGSASGVVTVSVPKSKKTDAAVDGGELYDSTR